jgi:hypothetical protein
MFSFKTKELPNMLPTLVIVNPIRFLFNDAAGCHVSAPGCQDQQAD